MHSLIKPLILFLLLSQFVTIAHAFEHESVHAEDKPCLICIHQSESAKALINQADLETTHSFVSEDIGFKGNHFYTSQVSLSNNRDPPYTPE